MKSSPFFSILLLYISYVWVMRISSALIPAYLHQSGTSLNQLFLANAIQFIPTLVILIFFQIRTARLAWSLSLVAGLLSMLSAIYLRSPYQVYLIYFLSGASLALFFVYYNVGHFLYTPKQNTGTSGGIMFAVSPAISIVAPLLAGFLATTDINYLWGLALLSFVLAFSLIARQPNFKIKYTLAQSFQAIRSTRIPIFLEGIWEAVLFAIIPILTLNFITDLGEYGKYLAYLSLVGTLAGLFVGRYTDQHGKRSYLLWPISFALALLTLALIYSQESLALWVVTTSLIQMIIPIFWNIMTTLVVDQGGDLKVVFPGREITLAAGRLLGLSATAYLVSIHQTNLSLYILALVIIALPFYLHYQSQIVCNYKYL